MEKTKKTVKTEWMQFGFQSKPFFIYFIIHLIFTTISILIIYYLIEGNYYAIEGNRFLKFFGLMSIIYLIVLYFFPSIVAFDLLQNYKDYNIPTLKHPYRWIIFFTNLLLGWSGIGWLILYFWSFIPGNVLAEIVTFDKYIDQQSVLDKEEKLTSDKEIISEKLPESPDKRLQKLADLKEKGLISDDDYEIKKKDILKDM